MFFTYLNLNLVSPIGGTMLERLALPKYNDNIDLHSGFDVIDR